MSAVVVGMAKKTVDIMLWSPLGGDGDCLHRREEIELVVMVQEIHGCNARSGHCQKIYTWDLFSPSQYDGAFTV